VFVGISEHRQDWVLEGQVQAVTSPWIVDEYREVGVRSSDGVDFLLIGWNF
jgi:hypothetical protein